LLTEGVLAAAVSLTAGCERQSSSVSQQATNPVARSSTATNQISPTQTSAVRDGQIALIQAGRVLMGEPGEIDAPPHEVVVGPFFIDKNLVTQKQYEAQMGENPSRWKGEANPVEQVRWSDAVRFCNKRSESEGLRPCYDLKTWTCNFEANGYRLPTEA